MRKTFSRVGILVFIVALSVPMTAAPKDSTVAKRAPVAQGICVVSQPATCVANGLALVAKVFKASPAAKQSRVQKSQ